MKVIIFFLIVIILLSLGLSLFYFSRYSKADPVKMAIFLRVRIILSVLLFIILIIAYLAGWIIPHGL